MFIITRIENDPVWRMVKPILPLGGIAFSRYKYGTMVKGILDTLLCQKSKPTE